VGRGDGGAGRKSYRSRHFRAIALHGRAQISPSLAHIDSSICLPAGRRGAAPTSRENCASIDRRQVRPATDASIPAELGGGP